MTELWERVDGRVGELVEGVEPLPDTIIPFDAASEEPMEEQKWVWPVGCHAWVVCVCVLYIEWLWFSMVGVCLVRIAVNGV